MNRVKRLRAMGAATGLGFCLAVGLHAAGDKSDADKQAADSPSLQQPEFGASQEMRSQQDMEIYEVTELHGLRVESSDGEQIGSVDSVAVDLQGESPSFIVVESGGILGIGADLKVVPIEAVEIVQEEGITGERQIVRVDIEKSAWEQISSHEAEEIAQLCERDRAREVHQQFNVKMDEQRTRQFGGREEMKIESETKHQQKTEQEQEFGSPDRPQQPEQQSGALDQSQQPEQQSGALDQSQQPAQQAGALDPSQEQEFGSPDRGQQQKEEEQDSLSSQSQQQEETQTQTQDQVQIEERDETVFGAREQRETTERRSETQTATGECELVLTRELEGLAIHDAQQQEVGTVNDLVFDLNSGQVQYVLIAPESGFFERTEQTYAVAPRTFRSITTEEAVLEIRREELEQAEVLTQTRIRQGSREGLAAQGQPQVFRYEREQMEFGRAQRSEEGEQQQQQQGERPEGLEREERSVPPPHTPPHARDSERGPPPHAQDPDRRGPPPHAQGQGREQQQEFGQPRDSEQQQEQERGQPKARDSEEEEDEDEESRPGQSRRSPSQP